MWIHPAVARELAEAAVADDYTGTPLVDRVAAAIQAAVEMEPDQLGVVGRRPGEVPVRVDTTLGPGEWRLEPRR